MIHTGSPNGTPQYSKQALAGRSLLDTPFPPHWIGTGFTCLSADLLIISAAHSFPPPHYQILHYPDSQRTRPIRTQHNFCLRQELCETTNRLGIKSRCIRTALSFCSKLLVWRHSLQYIVFPLYFALIDFVVKCIRRVLKPEVAHSQLFPLWYIFHLLFVTLYCFVASHT